jgi:hypothetical protein
MIETSPDSIHKTSHTTHALKSALSDKQSHTDPLFFVASWRRLNPAYKHIALILAIKAGPDNKKVSATNTWIARWARRAEMTVINARRAMSKRGFVTTQPDGLERETGRHRGRRLHPNGQLHTFRLRRGQLHAYSLQNGQHIIAPSLNCKRAVVRRILSWHLRPDLELVMLVMLLNRDPNTPENENWYEGSVEELAELIGCGKTTIRGYLDELENLNRIKKHQQEHPDDLNKPEKHRRPRRNRYELPRDGEDFVPRPGTRLFSSEPPKKARDHESERLLVQAAKKLKAGPDGWRPASHTLLGEMIGKHRSGITPLLRRLQDDGKLEFKVERRLTWIRLLDQAMTNSPARVAAEVSIEPLPTSQPRISSQKNITKRLPRRRSLTPREKIIRRAIREDLHGTGYVEFLTRELLATRERWQAEGCSAAYTKAYDDPYWKQRIQDERTKERTKMHSARKTGRV